MLANTCFISCNFPPKTQQPLKIAFHPPKKLKTSVSLLSLNSHVKGNSSCSIRNGALKLRKWCCYSSLNTDKTPQDTLMGDEAVSKEEEKEAVVSGGDGGGGGGVEERDWTTSLLIFVLWAGLIYYVFVLAPNQTPVTDMYFLKKLLNLKGDDGFQMNEVLVSLWYIMGLYPLMYSMLLVPSGRSSKSNVPVWPFLTFSFFGGAYALIPYFVLWRPPPPPVEEDEIKRWPLRILESKVTAGVTMAAGVALIAFACLSNADVWKEFYQYFRESRLVHATSIDFSLLSAFAPFWVYNDMTVRKWDKKGSWLLPLSIIPVLGPALYLFLRPSLSPSSSSTGTSEEKQE